MIVVESERDSPARIDIPYMDNGMLPKQAGKARSRLVRLAIAYCRGLFFLQAIYVNQL